MTTLRTAAQQVLNAYDAHEPMAVVMEALRTALSEPEQEPVALVRLKTESRFIGGSDMGLGCSNGYVTQRYLAIEFVNYNMSNPAKSVFKDGDVLYTHPPQRKPLTDEEIVDLWADVSMDYDDQINIIEMARAIERAHGIGGEG